ncbi:MAG: hypothetical protein B7Y42_00395 [Polaromonas sp. 28-63-22]|jgi:hypothetical protein|nr:MAG: hypothetical protein B7Y42_00395 [Polaromonas sp. 28-63-22]
MSRDCASLGICQSRKPACDGCTTQFAPGVIDGPYSRKRPDTGVAAFVVKALLVAALVASISLTIGFAAGYLTSGGVFP